MSRKPYHAKLPNDWFMKQPHFLHYMLREFTCIGIGLYVLNLMAGIVALANNPTAWMTWLNVQKNPVMMIVALFALSSALYHSYTWFGVTPKVFKIPKGDHFIPGRFIIAAHWIIFGIIAIMLSLVVLASS